MSSRHRTSEIESVIVTIGALVAGFAVGWLYSSPRGYKMRSRVAEEAARGVRWLDDQLLEARKRILDAGDQAAEQLRSAVGETVEKVIPELGTEADWQDVFAKTAKDIKNSGK